MNAHFIPASELKPGHVLVDANTGESVGTIDWVTVGRGIHGPEPRVFITADIDGRCVRTEWRPELTFLVAR